MNVAARVFEPKTAVRESVPLLVGLTGPSGGGKTYSALRLARGIQTVTGGDIYGIDTEARRMLHYADKFQFKHVQFDAPFGALDYLAAIRQCVAAGAKVIIVDSMSHEHEGPGGLIDAHEKELDRLAGDDWAKRERVNMLAWQKPKANRRTLINGILQLNANFIFCFRAKDTAKPVKKDGKTEIVHQGFMPIAGDEFVFEMTANCLLLPNAGGVPSWQSENIGERMMMKLPEQFKAVFAERQPLSEEIGAFLAAWAKGSAPDAPVLLSAARAAALGGKDALQAHWKTLTPAERAIVKPIMEELKAIATSAGQKPAVEDDPFADETKPTTETPKSEAGEPTPASGTAAGEEPPASPAVLTVDQKKLLRRYAEALGQTVAEKTLQKGSAAFINDHPMDEGTPLYAAAATIFKANQDRVAGRLSIDEAEAAVKAAIG